MNVVREANVFNLTECHRTEVAGKYFAFMQVHVLSQDHSSFEIFTTDFAYDASGLRMSLFVGVEPVPTTEYLATNITRQCFFDVTPSMCVHFAG